MQCSKYKPDDSVLISRVWLVLFSCSSLDTMRPEMSVIVTLVSGEGVEINR